MSATPVPVHPAVAAALAKKKALAALACQSPAVFASFVLRDEATGRPVRLGPPKAWPEHATKHPRFLYWEHDASGRTNQLGLARALWAAASDNTARVLLVCRSRERAAACVKALLHYAQSEAFLAVFPDFFVKAVGRDGIRLRRRANQHHTPNIQVTSPGQPLPDGLTYTQAIGDDTLDGLFTSDGAPIDAARSTWAWLNDAVLPRLAPRAQFFLAGALAPSRTLAGCEADLLRSSFVEFVRRSWHIVEPARPIVWGWHLEAMCLHLEAVARGEIQRLLINIPPGHAKSLIVSVLWPAWMWTRRPEWRAMFASYADNLITRDSVRCRTLIESPWFKELFSGPGGWELSADQNTKHYYTNTASGFRFSTTVGSTGTGFRGDCLVVDDPLKAMDAYSKAAREEVTRWFGEEMSSRFNDMSAVQMVVIMQRLHEEDLSGFVLAAPGWEHLRLPSEYEVDSATVTFHTVDGERREFWRDPRTEEGELLFPDLFPAHVLDGEKLPNRLGAIGFAAQHQQRPMPASGGMFKKEAWRFWKPDGISPDHIHTRPRGCYVGPARPLPTLERTIISVDASFKETEDGSFVAIHVWGRTGADRFLLDRVHARMDFDTTCRALSSVCARWPQALAKIIEEKANGAAIISQLGRRIPGFIPVNPEGGKESRAAATQPYQAAGNVYLPDGAPWLDEYVAEHAAFPKGKHNDDVDAQSQALLALEDEDSTAAMWARALL